MKNAGSWRLRPATEEDVPAILRIIKELALYEKAPERVEANEDQLKKTLFGKRAYAEVVLAVEDDQALGMALFASPVQTTIFILLLILLSQFHNYSTWLGKPGIYLEGTHSKITSVTQDMQ